MNRPKTHARSRSDGLRLTVFVAVVLCSPIHSQSTHADPCLPTSFMFLECMSALDDGITELDLSGRRITALAPGAFRKFAGIIILDLSNNLLRSISQSTFIGLHDLKTLKLNNNVLETLSGPPAEWMAFIPTLQELILFPNRFFCDCKLTWLVSFLATDDIIQDAAAVECAGPPPLAHLLIRNMPLHYEEMLCKEPVMRMDLCGSPGMFPCTISPDRSAVSCIPHHQLCDGVGHCKGTLSDENPFICNALRQPPVFTHPASSFLPPPTLFNGFPRYPMVFTPATPLQRILCRKGTFPCWSGQQCVPLPLVCDGKLDCADGADEDVSRCQTMTIPPEITTTNLSSPAQANPASTTEVALPASTSLSIDMSIVKSFLEELRANSTLNWLTKFESFSLATATEDLQISTLATTTSTTVTPTTTEMARQNVFRLSDLPQTNIEPTAGTDALPGDATEQATHATITFPQVEGSNHVNHVEPGFTAAELTAPTLSSMVADEVTSSFSKIKTTARINIVEDENFVYKTRATTLSLLVFKEGYSKPHGIRLINLPHNDVNVTWLAPIWPANWNLVAYTVCWEIENTDDGHKIRKKKSPLLSTLVHEYTFHHILPDESLKVFVIATYTDKLEAKYERVSDPVHRKNTVTVLHIGKDALAVTSLKQGHHPGPMGYEDIMGLSVGGALVCLMVLLLGLYFFKRKNSGHISGTNVRALRMRKVERYTYPAQVKTDRTLSSEPIYAEPENGYHEINEAEIPELVSSQALPRPPIISQCWDPGSKVPTHDHPEAGYVEVLDSMDSVYYGGVPGIDGHFSNCSEYSCYSVAASGNHVIMDPRLVAASQASSFAVYTDSEMSSTYQSMARMPLHRLPGHARRCNQPASCRQFGDTLRHHREAGCCPEQHVFQTVDRKGSRPVHGSGNLINDARLPCNKHSLCVAPSPIEA